MDKLNPESNRFYLSRKLIGVVAIFLIAASGLVVLTNFSINMIAATGDYMTLLSKWNQHHQQSLVLLERYTRSGEQTNYQEYVEVTDQMDNRADIINELFETDPDVKVIFNSLTSDNIYPNEISSLVFAFEQFGESNRVQNIYQHWRQLNKFNASQQNIAQSINREWKNEQLDQEQLKEYLRDLNELNRTWNAHNQQLITEVGNASAAIKRSGLWISVILGILLVLIGVVVTVRANKSIGRWEQTLNEKQILLSEIHHRVKNNMAVISGLLELESMQNKNPEQALQDSRDRIQSMAMIHEMLYQSESFSEIHLNQYLQKLTNYIAETYLNKQKKINLRTNFENVLLNINQAVPVGLIMNEMLANAISHGFHPNEEGNIEIHLSEEKGHVSLLIKDNGKGFPGDINHGSAESTGLLIVRTLVEQLDAEVMFANNNGASFMLQFQKSDASGAASSTL